MAYTGSVNLVDYRKQVERVMKFHRRTAWASAGAAVATVAAVALVALATAPAGATPETTTLSVRQAAAAETPSHIVEDYSYPGAEQILAERGITLLKGDGDILLAECGPSGLIQVRSAEKGLICFEVVGQTAASTQSVPTLDAWITMSIPSVYVIRGDENDAEVDLTANNETTTYDLVPNEWTPVGEGAEPENGPATLLTIRIY